MTTIAWDGKTLASDTQSTSGGYFKRRAKKIFRLHNGDLFAGAGNYDDVLAAVEWLQHRPTQKPTLKDFVGILIKAIDGKAYKLEEGLMEAPIHEGFFAIGTGRDFAVMAMYLGKSAREAVELAILFDSQSGGEIETIEVGVTYDPHLIKEDGLLSRADNPCLTTVTLPSSWIHR